MPVPTLESRKHSQRRGRLHEAAEAFATPKPAVASHAGPQEPLPHLWGLILAGGDGQRLQPLIKAWYGHARPKQYCTFFGGHSLLRQTLARVERLIPAARLLTVVTQAHMTYVRKELDDRAPETVIIQPCNRETGAGILLPLLHIIHRDPEAIVALFPSDHFIREEAPFMAAVATAVASLATHPRHLVLLGMAPEGPEREYGWIGRGDILESVGGQVVYRVQQFWEKPTPSVAESLYRRQALWNTMVLVGYARVCGDPVSDAHPRPLCTVCALSGTLGSPPGPSGVTRGVCHAPGGEFFACDPDPECPLSGGSPGPRRPLE